MKAIESPIKCDTITYDAPMEYLVLVSDEICVYRDHVKPTELASILGVGLNAQLMESLAPMKYADGYFKLEGNFLVGALAHPEHQLVLLRKAVLLCGQLSEVQFELATLLNGADEPLTRLDGDRIALMMAHIDPLVGNFETINDVTHEALIPLVDEWSSKFRTPPAVTPSQPTAAAPADQGFCCHCGDHDV